MKEYSPEEISEYVHRNMDFLKGDLKGNEYCVCPKCGDDSGRFSVNIYKSVFNCFRGTCKFKGPFESLFEIYGPPDASYDKPESTKPVIPQSPSVEIPLPKEKEWPEVSDYFTIWNEGFVPISKWDLKAQGMVWRSFFEKRHISWDFVCSLGVRFCENRHRLEYLCGRANGYFSFPYRDSLNQVQYFQYRISPSITSDKVVKWKFPKEVGEWNKTQFLYFVDPGNNHNLLVVCESILDAIRVGKNGVAIGGSTLSDKQLSLLIAHPAQTIVILMDGDKAGVKATKEIGSVLQRYSRKRILIPPDPYFSMKLDPDEFSDMDLQNLFRTLVEFNAVVDGSPHDRQTERTRGYWIG